MRSGSPQGVFGDLYGVAGVLPPYAVITSGGAVDVLVCVETCVALKAHTAANVATGAVHLNSRRVNLVMSCSLPNRS
jgi:hypothetical protein